MLKHDWIRRSSQVITCTKHGAGTFRAVNDEEELNAEEPSLYKLNFSVGQGKIAQKVNIGAKVGQRAIIMGKCSSQVVFLSNLLWYRCNCA